MASLELKCGLSDECFVLPGRIFGPLQRPESMNLTRFMIACVPANFTATTISAVSTADDIARYVYGCIGCSAECGVAQAHYRHHHRWVARHMSADDCARCPDRWTAAIP